MIQPLDAEDRCVTDRCVADRCDLVNDLKV
jgi:hypothetical protein